MADKYKEKVPSKKSSAKMPQLVAPIHAFDERNTKILYDNQRVILEHLMEFSKLALSIKKDMKEIIAEEVARQFDDKKIMLEGLYRKTIICGKLLVDAGHFTQEDINKKYEELKGK